MRLYLEWSQIGKTKKGKCICYAPPLLLVYFLQVFYLFEIAFHSIEKTFVFMVFVNFKAFRHF